MTSETIQIPLLAFMLATARLTGFFLNLPGFTKGFMPGRIRTLLVAALALLFLPLTQKSASALQGSPLIFWALGYETFIGYALGILIQLWLSALNVAGSIISSHTGMMNVFLQGALEEGQESIYGRLLGVVALFTLFFADLHYFLIDGLSHSYSLWPALTGAHFSLPIGDWATLATQTFAKAFVLSFQLSAPFIVLSLMVSLAAGIINRLMPTFQVFFVTQPLQVLLGILILIMTLPLIIHNTLDGLKHLIPQGGS